MSFDRSLSCITISATIFAAMELINRNMRGIVLVTDDSGKLLATVTDGDIRRALLSGLTLDSPLGPLLAVQKRENPDPPVAAAVDTDPRILLAIMKTSGIRQIPLLDANQCVQSIITLEELITPEPLDCRALILAGGFGSRLRPLTGHTIKPMLPVGSRPLLELTLGHLSSCGVQSMFVATHHRAEEIFTYFSNREHPGYELKFIKETVPLGTAGALALMPPSEHPTLMMNGDVLCRFDARAMLDAHRRSGAAITVGVTYYEHTIPYGVIESDGNAITRIVEKPTSSYEINSGIYLVGPEAAKLVDADSETSMPALIDRLIGLGHKVERFSIPELWIDIGNLEQYWAAQSADRTL